MKKRNILWVALLVLFVGFTSCNNPRKELEKSVEEIHKQLPMSIGMVGDITDIFLDDEFLEIQATVDESFVNIDVLQDNPELIHEALVQLLNNNQDKNMATAIDELKKSDLGMKLTYIGKDSGKKVSSSVNNEEIRNASKISSSEKNPMDVLNTQIQLTNAQLPMKIDEDMTMEKLAIEDGYVVYYYSWDDDMIELLKQSEDEMRQNIAQAIKSDDPSISQMVTLCKKTNLGMSYCYVGKNSGNKFEIRFSPDEL